MIWIWNSINKYKFKNFVFLKLKKVIKGIGKVEMLLVIMRNKMKDGVGDWIVLIFGVNIESDDFGWEIVMFVKKY